VLSILFSNKFLLTGNLHNWAFASRGCAIQWVHPRHHDIIYPAITGTKNDASYTASEAALEFYKWIGGMVSMILWKIF
jgi:hypothetical protein